MRKIDYIFLKDIGTHAAATMVGPIDGRYGLFVNLDDYEFDEETLLQVVLHEMVHYYLLLNGKQSKGEKQHDEIFMDKAREIEEITGIEGITKGGLNLRYKNKIFNIIALFKNESEDVYLTRIPDGMVYHWRKYFESYIDELNFKHYVIFTSNRQCFETITDNSESINLSLLPVSYKDYRKFFAFA